MTVHAAKRGVTLDSASAEEIARLGPPKSTRKLEGVLRLISAVGDEDLRMSARQALERVDRCGGDPEEAFRQTLAGGVELRPGVSDTVRYAAQRGLVFTPHSMYDLLRKRGRSATRRYIDQLGAIMDAASELGISCSQCLATTRLVRAGGDAADVIAGFRAEYRRRQDRRTARCRVGVLPRDLTMRSNALAGCGCPRCRDRLAKHMEPYIATMVANPFFARLDREEARGMARLEVMESLESWPGGSNFMGWVSKRFERLVMRLYAARALEDRLTVPLDAPGVLADDAGGRLVPLQERIPDRSCDVLTIVLIRERLAEWALERRQVRADRGEEYLAAVIATSGAPGP